MSDLTVTITVIGGGTAAAVSVLDGDQVIGEANDLDGLDQAITWLIGWKAWKDAEATAAPVKVTRVRAGLYRAVTDGGNFTIEHRWDIDGSWWVSDDDALIDPNRGVYPTMTEAVDSLR